MKLFRTHVPAEAKALDALLAGRRAGVPLDVLRGAERIVAAVRRGGDAALFRATARYDHVRLTPRSLRIGPAAMRRAWRGLLPVQRGALRRSYANILAFHRRQAVPGFVRRSVHGRFAFTVRPLERVAIHVPAASGPLVSTLLMCAGAARAAGVRDLVLLSPPRHRGSIHPAILAGAWLAGIREAYAMGGAQGVAAIVLGTRSVRPVDKVLGPGNAWVQAAQLLTQGGGRLDGPSEIVVLADGTAPASAVAADLVAQAEHAGNNPAVLVTPSQPLVVAVLEEVRRQLRGLPRSAVAAASLARFGAVVLVRSMREGLLVAERFSPEHLEVIGRGASRLAAAARCAGTVLVGAASPVAAADYGAGPNHVLPTFGAARYASGLGVRDFVKQTAVSRLSRPGLRRLGPALAVIARLEGLEGHARSLEMDRGA